MTTKSPETVLREALVVARDELKRVNDHVEKRIVGKLVRDLLDAGQNLSIWNGGDGPELKHGRDADAIFAALAASDQDEIVVFSGFRKTGWVRLVWGNDCSVISDYTTNIEHLLAGANALADELEG